MVSCLWYGILIGPSVGDSMDVFDAAERYRGEERSLVIVAGKDYGSGKW